MGMYELTGDKPGNGAYKAFSFGKKGTEWNYPVIVGTQYGDNRRLYSYVMQSADGQNYSPTDYVALATMDDLTNIYTEYNVANNNVLFRCTAEDGSAIQLATTGTQIQLQKRTSSSGSFETVWAK